MLKAMRKFFHLFLLVLGCLTVGRFALAEDATPAFDFGGVELTSCTDNVRLRDPIYLGLEITPFENWKIQDVDMQVTTSQDVPIQWFTPFRQPFYERQIYPISAVLTHKLTEPLTIYASGSIIACTQENCKTYPFHLDKTLGTERIWIMPECDELSQAIATTPVPMYMDKVKGWAIPNGENIRVTLDFQKRPKTIQIYDAHKNPLAFDIQAQGNRVQFAWPLQDENLHFFVRTYYAYYEVELPVLQQGTKTPMPRGTLFGIIQAVFLFFFLSAFPIFWARSTDAPYQTFFKQAKQSVALIAATGLCLWGFIYIHGPINLAFYPFSKAWALGAMALGILFIPAHVLLPFLFTVLAPRPYLNSLTTSFEQLTFIGFATTLIALVFFIQCVWAKRIFHDLQDKKTTSLIWWCARLPWIFFLIYLMIYL